MTIYFLHGALMALALVASLFFLRFWMETRDRLFLIFSLSFALLGLDRIVLLALSASNEVRPEVYLIRLAAFILIIGAIIDKNRPQNP